MSPFYWFAKGLFKIIYHTIIFARVKGLENIPRDQPAIIYSNHISWLDPTLIGAFVPRQIYFMAKVELFGIPLFGLVIKKLGAFPVNRSKPDRSAIKSSLEVLREGRVLGMFPEGTRSKDGKIGEALPGAVFIAQKAKVCLVPVFIQGPYRLFGRVTMVVGEPFELDLSGKERVEKGQVLLMDRVKELMGEVVS